MRRLLAVLVVVPASVATAQTPGIELQMATRTLEPNESVELKLVCTNIGQPGTPEAVVAPELELRLTSANPMHFMNRSVFNGRVTETDSYTYHLLLTARVEGEYSLGPISVLADGTRYETDPVTIVVRRTADDGRDRGDRYIFVEMDVQPTSLYVSESFTATLTIGIRKVEFGGQVFDMNLLRTIDARASQLSVFGAERFGNSERWLTDSTGTRHQYVIYQASKQVRAEDVGEMQIGPIFLKADYPTKLRRSFFDYDVSQSRRETAQAPAVSVRVKAPPAEDRPISYSGAIGRYTMEVTAKPERVEQGQPVTLTISIEGDPIEGVPPPDLSIHPELASRFDFVSDELLGDRDGRAVVFRRAIFPRQQGEQTIPPIHWSYFDPRREEYVTLTSDPIALIVDAPTGRAATIDLTNGADAPSMGGALTLLKGGISPNYVDPGEVLANQAFAWRPSTAYAFAFPPLFYLALAFITRHRARLRADAGWARRRRARRIARARIAAALRQDGPVNQLEALSEALIGYLSDKFNLPPGAVTPEDAEVLLRGNGAKPEIVGAVSGFLESCDSIRYAPGAAGDLAVSETARKVRGWIREIEGAR